MGIIYKWNKKEIAKEYLESIINVIKTRGKNLDYINDNAYLSDMIRILIKMPNCHLFISKLVNFKNNLMCDSYFSQNCLTDFQKEIIDKIIKNVLEEGFYIYGKYDFSNKINTDYVNKSIDFSKEISPLLYKELNNVLNNNRLYIDYNSKNIQFSGSCFSANSKNYYQVIFSETSNLFTSLNHENVHGLVNSLSNRRFDNDKSIILYREVGSILIELYANEYLLRNELIDEEEYIYNYNYVYLNNLYSNIELTDFLYRLSKINVDKQAKNIKKLIRKEKELKPNYDFELYELNELPLMNNLIYLYSSAIAISLFNNFKYEQSLGMNVALDIMLNINKENEKDLFKKYNINIDDSLNIYKKENNKLIKKRRSG